MAHWVKPPTAKPDDLNLLPGTYTMERGTGSFISTPECFGTPLNVPLEANVSLPSFTHGQPAEESPAAHR